MTRSAFRFRTVRDLAIVSAFCASGVTHGAALAADSEVAGYQSGSDLVVKCRGSSPHGQEYCFAYIAAAADSVRAYQTWMGSNDICIPRGTSQGQLRDIFIDYAVRHPSRLNDQAASIVILSLAQKFTCAPSKGGEPANGEQNRP